MRQAMEKMENRGFRAVPIIDENNKYVGTLSEGDLLWKFKNTPGLTLHGTEKVYLKDIPRRMDNQSVRIYASINDLITLVIDQNFVPVVDDQDVFIGIVRRREVLEYYTNVTQTDSMQEKTKTHKYPSHILADATI